MQTDGNMGIIIRIDHADNGYIISYLKVEKFKVRNVCIEETIEGVLQLIRSYLEVL